MSQSDGARPRRSFFGLRVPAFSPSKVPSSLVSSSRGIYKPVPILFPSGFRSGELYGWYHGLPKESRYISSLQIRKDVGNVVPHRFVMLRMHDGSTHRFDRRPEQKTKDHDPGYNLFGLMLNHAVNCEDSYIANMNRYLLKEIKKVTFCEIELFFDPEQADLVTVISACFGISQNRVAEKYTFLKHNCFFFSWTILMVVSRHCLPYKFPSYTPLKELFDSKVDHLTTFIVKRAIDVFLDLVIETVIIIRNNLGDMSLTKRLLPDRALRFLWRRLAIMRLNLGLRRRLVVQVRRQLDERLAPIHQTITAMGDIPDWLNKNLWIEEESGTIDPTLRAAINELKWEAVIDAISSGFKDLSSDRVDLGNVQLKKSILGKRFAQFTAVWKAALPDGMNAVKNAASELEPQITDEEAFDKCWTAAQDAAFNTAKTVVEATNLQVGNAQREVVWAKIFDIWPECWKETRGVVEPKSLAALNDIVDEVVRAGRDAVIQGLKKHSDGTLNVCLLKGPDDPEVTINMSNADLQTHMQDYIRRFTSGRFGTLEDINSSMAEIWREARMALQPAATSDTGRI